jgi:uncharacterized protein with PQ loop repeat
MKIKKSKNKIRARRKSEIALMDKIIIVAAFVYPMSALPQIFDVFSGKAEGVSVISWLCFAVFSALFLVYGLVHKVRPMIVTNLLWIIIEVTVVVGVVAHA